MRDMSGETPVEERKPHSDDEEEDLDSDDADNDGEDADDENEDSDNVIKKPIDVIGSDEEELWFDTSPDEDHIVLITAQEAAGTLQNRGAQSAVTPQGHKVKAQVQWKEMHNMMRPVLKHENFDTIPLHDKS